MQLHGRWPLLTPAVLASLASALGKKRMCTVHERLPTSVRQHSSNLAIVSSNKVINYLCVCIFIYMHAYTPPHL